MEGTTTYIPWSPPVETDLPHLEGMWNDIFFARVQAADLREILQVVDTRRMLVEPLFIAALAKYFRVFGSGRRPRKLRLDATADLPSDLRIAHQHLQAIRDKHIAHPVNQYEVHNVTLGIAGLGTPTARATVVSASTTALLTSLDEVNDLIRLCDFWLEKLRIEKEEIGKLLLEHAQKLTPEQLNALPSAALVEPDENPLKLR